MWYEVLQTPYAVPWHEQGSNQRGAATKSVPASLFTHLTVFVHVYSIPSHNRVALRLLHAGIVHLLPAACRPGDTARLAFQLSGPASSALVVWGNRDGDLRHTLHDFPSPPAPAAVTSANATVVALDDGSAAVSAGSAPGSLATILLPLGPECRRGCSATVVLSVPRAPASWAPPAVPTSRLFDPRAPHTATAQLQLTVAVNGRLNVSLTAASADDPSQRVTSAPPDADTSPGGRAAAAAAAGAPPPEPLIVEPGRNVTLDVAASRNGMAVGDVEITLVVVDRSIMDMLPYPMPDVAESMRPAQFASVSTAGSDSLRASQAAVDAAFEAILRRLKVDPWLPVDTQASITLVTDTIDACQVVRVAFWQVASAHLLSTRIGNAPELRGTTTTISTSS